MEKLLEKSKIPSMSFNHHFFFPITPLQFLNLSRTKITTPHNISVFRQWVGVNGVSLDWIKYSDIDSESRPVLMIVPGLTGCIKDAYVLNLANEAILNGGFNTCIYQMRLLNENVKITKKYLFLMDDIEEAIDAIKEKYGKDKDVYAVGYSYGANQMVKFMGQNNTRSHKIKAAVSISNPYEFIISSRLCLDKIYNRMLLSFLQKVIKKTRKSLEDKSINKDINIPCDLILKTNQITDFDDYYTSHIFGFEGADDYYRHVSSVNDIRKVDVPLLCISAKDDQICFKESIPFGDIKRNKNIALLVTSHGSHSCFIERKGLFGVKQWVPIPTIAFLKANVE